MEGAGDLARLCYETKISLIPHALINAFGGTRAAPSCGPPCQHRERVPHVLRALPSVCRGNGEAPDQTARGRLPGARGFRAASACVQPERQFSRSSRSASATPPTPPTASTAPASRPGGAIMIHGNCVTIRRIRLQDGPIEELGVAAVLAHDARPDRHPRSASSPAPPRRPELPRRAWPPKPPRARARRVLGRPRGRLTSPSCRPAPRRASSPRKDGNLPPRPAARALGPWSRPASDMPKDMSLDTCPRHLFHATVAVARVREPLTRSRLGVQGQDLASTAESGQHAYIGLHTRIEPQALRGDESVVYAKPGFNMIATANSRDRGVNELSTALKRRFNFVTIPIVTNKKSEKEISCSGRAS